MAPKDYLLPSSSFVHNDDNASCNSCTSTSQPTTTRKSVRFNSACHLKYYPTPTEDDRSNAWYNGFEYQRFKSNTKLVATACQEGKVVDGEEMMFGLASFDRAGASLKRERRYRVWDVVIDGQFEHNARDVAELCSLASNESKNDAQRVASLLQFSLLQDGATQELKAKGIRPQQKRSLLSRRSLQHQPTVSRMA